MINFKYIKYCVCFIQILSFANGQDFGNIAGKWKIKYGLENEITEVRIKTSTKAKVPVQIYDIEKNAQQTADIYFRFIMENKKIASTEKHVNLSDIVGSSWHGEIEVNGLYFGYTHLYVTLNDPQMENMEKSPQTLSVVVLRNKQVDDNIFTYTALAIMILMFVNLGTVLDLKRIRLVFTRPVGPILGFLCRYLVMPALALGLGALMFKEQTNLQLALLFSAIAPSGGIANICNIFLKGNINLSLATTTVNSVLALGMLPLWVYLMGPLLYKDGNLSIPFAKLGIGCAALLLALIVGVLLRVTIPKTTKFIFRFLKPVSVILSLSLVAVTVGINAFVFKEITLMIILAAFFLPIIGYLISFTLSKLLCCSVTDAMTIAVETSVLNMSLPIVLLEYTVHEPMADMLIVVPVISALMSLCLIIVLYVVRRIFGWNTKRDLEAFDEEVFLMDLSINK